MKEIQLSQGLIAIVDDEDHDHLSAYKWHIDRDGYAVRNAPHPQKTGKRITLYMHRYLLGLRYQDGIEGDHIDGDKRNNQKSNLRIATRSQNVWNRMGSGRNKKSSPYKGVTWHKRHELWASNITIFRKQKHLGYYKTPEEAYEVYCLWADMLHGDFSNHGKVYVASRLVDKEYLEVRETGRNDE